MLRASPDSMSRSRSYDGRTTQYSVKRKMWWSPSSWEGNSWVMVQAWFLQQSCLMVIRIFLFEKLQILFWSWTSRILSERNALHENTYSLSGILSPAVVEYGSWSLNMFMLVCRTILRFSILLCWNNFFFKEKEKIELFWVTFSCSTVQLIRKCAHLGHLPRKHFEPKLSNDDCCL